MQSASVALWIVLITLMVVGNLMRISLEGFSSGVTHSRVEREMVVFECGIVSFSFSLTRLAVIVLIKVER